MAAPKAHKEYSTFVKGLITEASDLTFPENASLDEDNCVLNRDGSRQRRQGMDYESGYLLSENLPLELFQDLAVTAIEWKYAANNGLFNFVVIQVGTILYIHDMGESSIGAVKVSIDMSIFQTPFANNFGFEVIQAAAGNGYLFCTSKDTEPFYIQYDPISDTFSASVLEVKIRDFVGVRDGKGALETVSKDKLYWGNFQTGIIGFFKGETLVGATSGATAVIDFVVYLAFTSGGIANGYFILKDIVGDFSIGETVSILGFGPDGPAAVVQTAAPIPDSSDDAKYNLRNQGWSQTNIDTYATSTGSYPDNTKIWYHGKNSSDVFAASLLDLQGFGSTPAPKGHFILDAFNLDRSSVSSLSVEAEFSTVEKNRPSTAAFYAGRVFYSGVESSPAATNSTNPVFLNSYIYFSQILETIDKAGKCYQDADPTAEHNSDLVETDGGTILIPEVGKILKLEVVDKFLIVIANNGVWSITGSESGFSPTSFVVSRVSNVGALGAPSVVDAEGFILYWSDSGIYALTLDGTSQTIKATNITESTIHTFYSNIKTVAKTFARGIYDSSSRKIKWLYSSDTNYDGVTSRHKYNRELVFDTLLTAFYPTTVSSLASDSPYIAGVFSTPSTTTSTSAQGIVVGIDAVQVDTEGTQVTSSIPGEGTTSLRYLTVVPQTGLASANYRYTFSNFNNAELLDWITADSTGIDYSSFLVTGAELMGDSSRDKTASYLTVHSKQTETGYILDGANLEFDNPSSLFMQARWGWSDHTDSGRWTLPQQVYRFNRNYTPSGAADTFTSGFRVVTTKNRLRGHGKAVSLYFYSETGKDFKLLGWATDFSGEEVT